MAIDKWEILRQQNEALVRVYKDAYVELADRLKHQLERGLSTRHAEALVRDIQEIVRQLDEYTYDWLVANVPLAYEIGSETAVQKLAQYGLPNISVSFGAVHLEAVRAIVQDAFQSVAGATEMMEQTLIRTLRDSAKGIFQTGIATGETRKRLTKELMIDLAEKGFTMFEDSKGRYIKLKDYIEFIAEDSWVGFVDAAGRKWDLLNYTEMLTRTKITEAVSRGTENRLVENGLDLVIITAHNAPDWCRFYEGKVFSVTGKSKDYPPLSEAPNGGTPFHPRCVVGGTLITGPRPIVSFSRWYEGEVVVIRTSGGNELTVTPNHPILTPKGWVAAGLLNEGNQIIRYLGQQGMMKGVDPDYIDIPTLIEEIASSLGHTGGVSSRSVPVAAEDFHGDGKGSNVCVIRTNSLLGDDRNTLTSKPFSYSLFSFANIGAMMLNAKSAAAKLIKRMFFPPSGLVRSFNQSVAAGLVKALPSCFHRFRVIFSNFNSKLFQSSLNSCIMDSEGTGDIFLSFPGLIAIKDLFVTNRKRFKRMGFFRSAQRNSKLYKSSAERSFSNPEGFGKGLQAFAGQIALDTIIHVNRYTFAGHVYNLQTKYNWYACNTIITHNCKHREAPFIEKFEDEETIRKALLDPKLLGLNKDGHADQAALIKLKEKGLKDVV